MNRGGATLVQTMVLVAVFLGATALFSRHETEPVYVVDQVLSPDAFKSELYTACLEDDNGAPTENAAGDVPSIAVVGDSISTQTRKPALATRQFRWRYFTHCGETFRSALDGPRIRKAVDSHSDVLVIALGTNSLTVDGRPPDQIQTTALTELKAVLDATDSVPCRVLVNLTPQSESSGDQSAAAAKTRAQLVDRVNTAMADERRPGLHLADWASRTTGRGSTLLADGVHLTRAGINERLDLVVDTAKRCLLHQ